jgi:hypothetical protein
LTERRDIGLRLENWARWATARGRRGADCMTGAICDSMRRSALGDVWSGHEVSAGIDAKDASRIQMAMPRITVAQRVLLNWCYIEQARPEIVARKCGFPVKEFVARFRDAQAAVEDAADDLDDGNR